MTADAAQRNWIFADVEFAITGCNVLAEVKVGEPLRPGVVVTVDANGTPPTALVRDGYGQLWNVPGPRMWVDWED
jgi:hypothetical protein